MMAGLLLELRHALRQLGRRPAFTVAVVLTLGLGIGGVAGVFALVDAALLRPLVYDDAERLYLLTSVNPERTIATGVPPSYPEFRDWREQARAFEGLAFARGEVFTLHAGEVPRRVLAGLVTEDFFDVLRAPPHVGRSFTAEEAAGRGDPVVVLSHRFWTRELGADSSVVGRSVRLGDRSYTVVGVMGPGFRFPMWAQLWMPYGPHASTDPGSEQRDFRVDAAVVGKLAAGLSPAEAAADLDRVSAALAEVYPESEGWTARLAPLRESVVGDVSQTLLVLGAAVALVLLIACANVANLFLARVAARRRELGVRAALGAARHRLAGHLLAESLVLALAGAALGLLFAHVLVGLAIAASPLELPRLDEVAVDLRVIAVAGLLGALVAVGFGGGPALRASRPDLRSALSAGDARAGEPRSTARFRGGLVVAQVALAVVLLSSAALLLSSLHRQRAVDPGFPTDRLLTLRVFPPPRYEGEDALERLYESLRDAIAGLPGVAAVGYTNHIPMTGALVGTPVEVAGYEPPPGERAMAAYRVASAGYLEALGMPVVRGRPFTEADMTRDAPAVLVNETFARRYWPDRAAVGQSLTVRKQVAGREDFGERATATVVGVVSDVHFQDPGNAPVSEVFLPFARNVWSNAWLAIRTAGDPEALKPAVQRAVLAVDADIPATDLRTMEEVVGARLTRERLLTTVLAGFATIALLLACIGLYGLLAYLVARRAPELGVRLALGARPADVLRLVVGHGLALVAGGLALGLLGAALAGRLIEGMLFEVGARDPMVLGVVAVALCIVAAAATLVPARRAANIDPMISLRTE